MNQDSKNMAILTWIGTLFLGFFPSLIMYLMKKDDEFANQHVKEALNWSITAIIGYIVGLFTMLFGIGVLIMIAIGITHMISCILGAVKASNGIEYKTWINLRLIK